MKPTGDVHLVFLIHGLWGSPAHLKAAKYELEQEWIKTQSLHSNSKSNSNSTPNSKTEDDNVGISTLSDSSENENGHPNSYPNSNSVDATSTQVNDEELVVVIASGMTSELTYDGVDVCASRVVWEVDRKVEELEQAGKRITKFSVTGYSLGGLVARFLVGLLHSRTPSFFDKHHPVSFSTIATPHLGIPRYSTFLSTVLCWIGSHLLARSGSQLYVTDFYSDDDKRPLLEIMADPSLVFMEGLQKFERLMIYGNAVKDETVAYPSALIETTDHFLEWEERGIEVEFDSDDIITSWKVSPISSMNNEDNKGHSDSETSSKSKSGYGNWSKSLGNLPPVLRPRFPYNYIILLLFPILLPLAIILFSARLSLDSRKSSRRLKALSQIPSPTITSNSSSPTPDSSSPYLNPLSSASASGLSIESLRRAIRKVERSFESEMIESADQNDDYTVPTRATKSTHSLDRQSITSSTLISPQSKDRHDIAIGVEVETFVKLRLKESQLRMAVWLNNLPLRKTVTWYPDTPNSHSLIVVRDPQQFPWHNRGRGLLRRWAKGVLE